MTGGMGFVQATDKPAGELNGNVERTAQEAARRKVSSDFINRLDQSVFLRRPVDSVGGLAQNVRCTRLPSSVELFLQGVHTQWILARIPDLQLTEDFLRG